MCFQLPAEAHIRPLSYQNPQIKYHCWSCECPGHAAYQMRAESHADPGLGFPGWWVGEWWACADGFIFRVLKCQSNVCQLV